MADDPKVQPPRPRRRLVQRTRLLDRLLASDRVMVSVTAPAGYGKTTLLAQWAERDPRPFAWVSLDDQDNDPAVLLGWLAAAFSRLPGAGPYPAQRLTGRRVGAMLARCDPPPVVVLDDVHVLHDISALDTITDLLPYLPDGSALAFGGRAVPVSVGRLRVQLDPLELGPQDLALDDDETHATLIAEEIEVDREAACDLRTRTEGWAALVALTATAARNGADIAIAAVGDERSVAQYLHTEVMARLDPASVEFLRRSAVLDELTGAMCDAVLERTGSALLLESLAADHHLVLPVGTGRERYRYHPVLRDLLLAELRREDAGEVSRLRLRAAQWSSAHAEPWAALQYSYDAGDLDEAADRVASLAQPAWAAGRGATLGLWLERLDEGKIVDRRPDLSTLWAIYLTLEGQAAEADRWTERALGADGGQLDVDGAPSLEAMQSFVRALRCADGPDRMRDDAQRLAGLMPPRHPWVATAVILEGVADLLDGSAQRALDRLAEGATLAGRRNATGSEIGALGMHAVLLSERGDWDGALEGTRRAMGTIERYGLDGYGLAGIVHAAAVQVFDHHGDEAARRLATARFDALRPRLTYAMPYTAVLGRLGVARVQLAHGEWEAARTLLSEMQSILRRRPALGRLGDDVRSIEARLGDHRGELRGGSTLTVAELRLLPLLPTHLSFRGIGERLFLSPHTIKTQSLSIYRKLGATSRDQAVTRAREVGLLDD